jgi:hypothetical protein
LRFELAFVHVLLPSLPCANSDTHCPTLGTGAPEDRDPHVIENELLDGPTHSCEPDTVATLPVNEGLRRRHS